ncbi:MAG: HEAT repeat domain-containing protein [Planctomycetales bacterium]|nr:HEAT repeat domain-containing protein [Planctomycetales bacterium]
MARSGSHSASWRGLLGALLLASAIAAGCGGSDASGKPSKSGEKSGAKGGGKRGSGAAPSAEGGSDAGVGDGAESAKPKVARSRSGKTAGDLVNDLAESYRGTEPGSTKPEDLRRREEARAGLIEELISLGDKGIPELLRAVNHPEPEIREWVCVALGEIASADASEKLVEIALGRDRSLAVHACDALGRIKAAGAIARLDPLAKATAAAAGWRADGQAGLLRGAAGEALARGGVKSGVPALIENLASPHAEVRRDALVRLRRLTGKEIPAAVDAPASARDAVLQKWRDWWSKNQGLFRAQPREGLANHEVFVARKE